MAIPAKAPNVGQQPKDGQLADRAHTGRRIDAATLDQGRKDHRSLFGG